ncbi:MAG TPA: hypothetical protein VF765_28320 [Polyangiaceae bacterium]
MRTTSVTIAVLAASLPGLISCSKKDDPAQLAPSASSLASSQASPAAMAWHYAIDPKSTTHVDMPGLKEHIKGDTTAAKGTLDVVGTDLAQSRGTIMIDLATFATNTFGNDDDATQTKHARTWLEVVVDGQTHDDMRWATLAIRAIDGLSAFDLSKVAPSKDGNDDVRSVDMVVHGDVLVHGHKLQKDVPVTVAFRYPSGAAPTSEPTRVDIQSKAPMRVVLKEVDVQPRDTVGTLTAWTTSLVSKVAEYADVTVKLGATPAQ